MTVESPALRSPVVEASAVASSAAVWQLAKRSVRNIARMPSTFVPSLVMPAFLTVAFTGPFGRLVEIPGFPAQSMIDWIIPMTTLQGSAIAGVTTGMGIARDLENGFYDRFLLSPVSRTSLLAGPLLASMLRALFPLTLLLVIAWMVGAHFFGGPMGILVLAIASLGMALAAGAWSIGLALRFKTYQVAPLMQMGMMIAVFLSTAQMPLALLTGWLHQVARFNPVTNVLELARQGFLGDVSWGSTWPGLVSLGGMCAVLLLFAWRGIQKVVP
jgi:ABC transporter DrrB family efflux protein